MTVTPSTPETRSPPEPPPKDTPPPYTNPITNMAAEGAAPMDEAPDWVMPRHPPRRGFAGIFSTKGRNKNFANEDTEYHGSSKEAGVLGAGAGAGVGAATVGTEGGIGGTGASNGLSSRFNNWMPAHRSYCGLSRKIFLIVVAAVFLALLALILGLAIGLSKKHSSSALPLPSNTGHFTGDITYYDPGGPGYGSCGLVSYSTSSICAISHIIYDAASTSSDPNDNPLCNKQIRITRYDSSEGRNKSVDVTVVDRCVGCAVDDLDLSESMFAELADVALGRTLATWAWL